MNRSFVSGAVLTMAVAAFGAGCGAEEPKVGEGSDDVIQTAAPMKPVDFATCFVAPDTTTSDAFFQAHELRCTKLAHADYPFAPSDVIVEVRTAKQNVFHGRLGDSEGVLGRFRNDDLPLRVQTRLLFDRSTTAGDSFGLKSERTIDALAAATRDKPLAFKSPFTLWGIALRSADASRLFVSGRYDVSTGPYKNGFNFTIPDNDKSELAVRLGSEGADGKIELALIAPASGPVTLNVNGHEAQVSGPGAFVLEGDKLVRDQTAPQTAPTPAPEDVAPAPAPTCGADGQARCSTGECAPGHRFDGMICRVCGGDGQTYCGSYSSPACSPGHRYDGTICRVCGGDGQTYCGSYSSPACSPGHRYDGMICRVCGGEGQTYCGSYSARACNTGFRLVGDTCAR